VTYYQRYRLSYITALMAWMSATRILSSSHISHQRSCSKINNDWFPTHVDTSRSDYSFKVQSNYEILLLFNHRCHYCIITPPLVLVRTESSKVYIIRLSLPLHVIHSSHLTVILNTVRTTNVLCAYLSAFAVKFQTKLDFVRAWRRLVSNIPSWLFWWWRNCTAFRI